MKNGMNLPARPAARPKAPVPVWVLQLAFLAAHAPLALAIPKRSGLGTAHALLVFGIGLIAAVRPRRPQLVAYTVAYITGAAVLWRMKHAGVPWEYGKYATVAILVVVLVFSRRVRRPLLPISYFLLLLPSALLTVTSTSWLVARDMLSFNLSGPLTLAVSVIYFSSLRLTPAQMRWLTVCLLAPIVSIATFAAYNLQAILRSFADIEFGGSSNAAASGGFGPNQVAAILGLGIVATAVYLMLGKTNLIMTGAMLALMLFLVRQCAVTFSRAGIYMAVGGLAAASFYLLRERRSRWRLIAAGAVVVTLLIVVVVPRLEAISGGTFTGRFKNTSTTGRSLLIAADFESFSESPFFGVGPGLGGRNRLKYFYVPTAHTEYSRMLAEHGLLGLIALAVLGVLAARTLRKRTLREKAVAAAFMTYSLLFMAVDATRLSAPGFAFGVSFVGMTLLRRKAVPEPAPRMLALAAAGRRS